MANRSMFSRSAQAVRRVPDATTVNDAGGLAYTSDPKFSLALYACTGTFQGTYHAKASDHLSRVENLLKQMGSADLEFVAKVAVYARTKCHMKDTSAYMLAWLMANDTEGKWFPRIFSRIVDRGKMACTFWQIVRSGAVGRQSLGTRPKRVIAEWLESRSLESLFHTSIGTSNPSLADVIRVAHPRGATPAREAMYAYLLGVAGPKGKKHDPGLLPELVQSVEAFKRDQTRPLPDVSFQLLSSLPLRSEHWREIALNAPWQTLRMNLNTFARHGVLQDHEVVVRLADKLRDEQSILAANAFPYQLLAAYRNIHDSIPRPLIDALHDALEIATRSVPAISGKLVICPDVSPSMTEAITGKGTSAPSKVSCLDVAALMTACLLRKNTSARILPFASQVVDPGRLLIEPRDTILTNAEKLATLGRNAGGTNCSAPLYKLCAEKTSVDTIIVISDYESWVGVDTEKADSPPMAVAWARIKSQNPGARLICADLTPRLNHQVKPDASCLCVGGFSDEVFSVMAQFAGGDLERDQWLRRIEQTEI